MIKFILLYCCERDLHVLGCFDNISDARNLMKEDFLKALKDENIEIDAYFEKDVENFDFCSDNAGIEKDLAWFNGGSNYDWKIEEVKI